MGLLPYQVRGVATLLASSGLLLADEMGLGKTIQAATAIQAVLLSESGQALVVAPAGLLKQWRRELHTWAPKLRVMTVTGAGGERRWKWRADCDLFLVGYETLRSDIAHPWVGHRSWSIVVLDEAQKIKNRKSTLALACKKLLRKRSWALTGTPLENNLDELASIMEFVDGDGRRRVAYTPGLPLTLRHAQVQLRRRKAEVLRELPDKQVIDLHLPLLESQQRSYDRAFEEGVVKLRAEGPEMRVSTILELILRLKQICNICPVTGESSKLSDLAERLDILAQQGDRALVFSQFVEDPFGLKRFQAFLSAHETLVFHGGLGADERDGVLETFRADTRYRALLLSLKAGGVGLNLQEAAYVFHVDRWWNPATELQAEGRSHRMGQKQTVFVYRYISDNTVEERVDEILRSKQALFAQVVDNVSIDPMRRLSKAELVRVLGLGADT